MVYQIIFKKRFQSKLENLLSYIENEFGLLVAQRFAKQLDKKFLMLEEQPHIGQPSLFIKNTRALLLVNITGYTIELKATRLLF